jgi:uncharacterized protein (DUF362 family)/ferredoxin
MTRSKIILVACPDYSPESVGAAFTRIKALAAGNGIELPTRAKLILKPNMLAPDPPEKAVTTHPEIFKWTARLLREGGNELFYGDSSGEGVFNKVARITGIGEAARAEGVRELDFSGEKQITLAQGKLCRSLVVSPAVLKPGYRLINLPKLKTHGQMIYTGAIKNLFGCVPGIKKKEAHLQMFSGDNFAQMIVDLCAFIDPLFTVMDAVVAMEGNGPRAGTPRALGFIMAGSDPLAIDSLCARIIGLDPHSVPILKYAAATGLGNIAVEQIEVVGDDWRAFRVKDFRNYAGLEPQSLIPAAIVGLLKKYLTSKPVCDHRKCTACAKCVIACPLPTKAVSLRNGKINFDYRQCIRCFCCQEICPAGAIYIKENVPWKILSKVYRLIKG